MAGSGSFEELYTRAVGRGPARRAGATDPAGNDPAVGDDRLHQPTGCQHPADPGEVQQPAGSPPGKFGEQMVRDVATAVAECRGGPPEPPTVLVAWGRGHDPGNQYWGYVGPVTKRATRIRVLFGSGISPLELVPIQAGDRFRVNFYAGFYRQPKEAKNLEWFVTRVIAYDSAGNKVAESQGSPGPGHSC